MGFKIVYSDITNYKVQAIVNSLGVNSINYGRICRSIIKAANSSELEDFLKSKYKTISVGDVFKTPGYGLPCKQILHLVTPHFSNDPNFYAIQMCIRNILIDCRSNKIYSVAFPLLGTGADHYPKDIISIILCSMLNAFASFYPEMDLTLVLLPKGTKDIFSSELGMDGRDLREDWEHDLFEQQTNGYLKNIESKNIDFDRAFNYSKEFFEKGVFNKYISGNGLPTVSSDFDENRYSIFASKYLVSLDKYNGKSKKDFTANEYIVLYNERRYENNIKLENKSMRRVRTYLSNFAEGSGKDNGSKLLYKVKKQEKEFNRFELYKVVLALHMNPYEAKDLFNYCGLLFCPTAKERFLEDYCIRLCLSKGIYDFKEVNQILISQDLRTLY